jgi:peptidyl-tRNA hydrolase
MEMKKQHFDHGYIEALDVAYVKVQELEADNEDTKEDGEEEEDIGKEEMKGKGKKVVDVYDEDEITPIDTFMMKKEIVEALVQYNGKE